MSTTCSKANATRAHGGRRIRRGGRPMRGSSAVANPVHRHALPALQLRPRHGSLTKRERAASRSVTVPACFQRCPQQCFENCKLYKFLLFLSFSLSFPLPPLLFLLLPLNFLHIHTHIRSGPFSLSLFLFMPSRTLKLVSVSHGLSVVPALLVHALLVAGSSSPRRTWTWIFPFLIFRFQYFSSNSN